MAASNRVRPRSRASSGSSSSQLFGHERGAFTGADRLKRGRFELAEHGTLLLDEIADLAPVVQAKLLRALEEREYERVGGTTTLRADVRLVAATNHDLDEAVRGGRIRVDLYYRLAVFRLHLPPLRERSEDVLPLADHFLRTFAASMGRPLAALTSEARDVLLTHDCRATCASCRTRSSAPWCSPVRRGRGDVGGRSGSNDAGVIAVNGRTVTLNSAGGSSMRLVRKGDMLYGVTKAPSGHSLQYSFQRSSGVPSESP